MSDDPVPPLKQQLAQLLVERVAGWSQIYAADLLGTDQPRVSDLRRRRNEAMAVLPKCPGGFPPTIQPEYCLAPTPSMLLDQSKLQVLFSRAIVASRQPNYASQRSETHVFQERVLGTHGLTTSFRFRRSFLAHLAA